MAGANLIDKWLLLQAALADPDLSPAAKVVMGRLLDHHNAGTGQCTPSFETIAKGGGMARRTAVRSVRELRESGWIRADRDEASGSFVLAFERAPKDAEVGTKRSLGRDQTVPSGGDETVPRLGTKRCSELGTKRSLKHGNIEHGNGTQDLSIDPVAFDEFWQAYPRKVSKDAARKAYDRAIGAGRATADDLIAGAERYAAERQDEDPKYTKHAATWLNAGCWSDEPAPMRPTAGRNSGRGFSATRDWLMTKVDEDE